MKNYFKKLMTALLVFTLTTVSFSSIAGMYTQPGYVTAVKANNVGDTCFIVLRYDIGSLASQAGFWPCHNASGQNMLALAKTAKILKTKVEVIFEGNGEYSKPVYAIQLVE